VIPEPATLDAVLPNDIDDPAAPSGGNGYDRHVLTGLAALGWSVREHPVRGHWPAPLPTERAALGRLLASLPDGATVLVDGLVGSAVPDLLRQQAYRLRLAVLVHLPLGGDAEGEALRAARTVIATSGWTSRRLRELYDLPAVAVAAPGVDAAPPARGSGTGQALLCVAALTPHKGQDRLARALATLTDLPWTCVFAGPLDRDPAYAARVRHLAGERVRFAGTLGRTDLGAAYDRADLLVVPSRVETYGMVVTEALARGVPVLATPVGGLPEALGRAPDGSLPGLLTDDLGAALRDWLTDPGLRGRLRDSALARRGTLTPWSATAERVSTILAA
jgi:glycosyltransferase involved in cell wall biosynthesis